MNFSYHAVRVYWIFLATWSVCGNLGKEASMVSQHTQTATATDTHTDTHTHTLRAFVCSANLVGNKHQQHLNTSFLFLALG